MISDQSEERPTDLAIVDLILRQMNEVKADLLRALNSHASEETTRWKRHEKEHREADERFEELADRITAMVRHDEHEKTVLEARLGPVRAGFSFIRREWRTIALVLGLITQTALWASITFNP